MAVEPESANTPISMNVDGLGEHLTSCHVGLGITINLPETSAVPALGPRSPGGQSIPKAAPLDICPEISAPVVWKPQKLTQYFVVATEERAANDYTQIHEEWKWNQEDHQEQDAAEAAEAEERKKELGAAYI